MRSRRVAIRCLFAGLLFVPPLGIASDAERRPLPTLDVDRRMVPPAISRDSFYEVDLTSQLLGDIGWPLSFAIDPPPPNRCIVAPLP